MMVLHK